MTTRPVAVKVSQATRLDGSSVRQASRIASETWSAILSGWPSVTDSEVNRWRFFDKIVLLKQSGRYVWWGESAHNGHMKCKLLGSRKGYQRMSGGAIFLGQPAATGSERGF